MKFKNFGNFYYPPKYLTEDLEKLIIFTENNTKKDIPNGSVFIYTGNKDYKPEILNTDVGCGITSFIIDEIDFNEKSVLDIMKIVNEIGIHIGQGNHFLDFTTSHPILRKKRRSNMIYLHSDFNNKNILPKNYFEAKDLEKEAKNKRIEYLESLTKLLGVSGEFYKDWIHNSVNKEEGSIIYRKGAINLNETDGVGALALNPIDGIYLYAGDFSIYNKSVQHGVGRIGSKGELLKKLHKRALGIARSYQLDFSKGVSHVKNVEQIAYTVYNSMDLFRNNFFEEYSPIGVTSTKLVITTNN